MSDLTRRINRALGKTIGVQITAGRTRPVRLDAGWFTRALFFQSLLAGVSDVDGDIVECGVANGAGLAMMASVERALATGRDRRIYGFDAWAGLPAPSEADLASDQAIATKGLFGGTSLQRVFDELAAYGWSEKDVRRTVRLVPGYFDDTLPHHDRPIAFLHIDVDLYESYRSCLNLLWPQVQPGGIVVFDEYEEPDLWPGARRAVDEFLATTGEGAATLHEDQRSGKWWVLKGGSVPGGANRRFGRADDQSGGRISSAWATRGWPSAPVQETSTSSLRP
jgi:hypothetical protein